MALSVIKYQCSWLMSLLYVFDPAKLIGHQFEFLIEQLNLFVNCLIFKLSNLCLVRSCKGKGGGGGGVRTFVWSTTTNGYPNERTIFNS